MHCSTHTVALQLEDIKYSWYCVVCFHFGFCIHKAMENEGLGQRKERDRTETQMSVIKGERMAMSGRGFE